MHKNLFSNSFLVRKTKLFSTVQILQKIIKSDLSYLLKFWWTWFCWSFNYSCILSFFHFDFIHCPLILFLMVNFRLKNSLFWISGISEGQQRPWLLNWWRCWWLRNGVCFNLYWILTLLLFNNDLSISPFLQKLLIKLELFLYKPYQQTHIRVMNIVVPYFLLHRDQLVYNVKSLDL